MSNSISKLSSEIDKRLSSCLVPASILTNKLKYVTKDSYSRSFFGDPRYYPFYYYFGDIVKPKSILDMTLGNAVACSCLIMGSRDVQNVLAFQKVMGDSFYPLRLAKHNIRSIYRGKLQVHAGDLTNNRMKDGISSNRWDAAILNSEMSYDEYLSYLRFIWPHISENGILIMDYINYHKASGQAYIDFCKTANRTPVTIHSKFGVGLLQK